MKYKDDWEVRWAAATTLGRIGEEKAAQPLVNTLVDKEKRVRAAALRSLIAMGRADLPVLNQSLNDDSQFVRREAVVGLGKTEDPGALEFLVAALGDKSVLVREKAAETLGQTKDIRAVAPLSKALQDDHPIVRERASETLRKIGDLRPSERIGPRRILARQLLEQHPDWTQTRVARELGVSRQAVSKWVIREREKQDHPPSHSGNHPGGPLDSP